MRFYQYFIPGIRSMHFKAKILKQLDKVIMLPCICVNKNVFASIFCGIPKCCLQKQLANFSTTNTLPYFECTQLKGLSW